MLVNTAIEQCTIGDLGAVVLDELHMIDDDHRGYLMELLATKLLSLEQSVQIVGMSATLPNTPLLAKWLNAKYYESKFKPVLIQEYLVSDSSIHPIATASAFYRALSQTRLSQPNNPCRMIQSSTHWELRSPVKNAVVALAIETASEGYGVLVFCSSRSECEVVARLISRAMPECNKETTTKRQDIVHDLRALPVGLDETLESTIPAGVAFHHAGLAAEEREILARAYDDRIINVIVATCSLAAGINLPARRVILHALLEVIAVRLATHINAIEEYVQRTLLCHTIDKARLKKLVEDAIHDLQNTGQIRVESNGSFKATSLSRATVGSCMTPEDGLFVHDELQRALRAFVMDGEMHIFYMFTPLNIWGIGDINWRIFRDEIERLDESGLRVLQFVGISPAFVNRMANSGKQLTDSDVADLRIIRVYRRFYAAFQLRDLCNEVPIPTIAQKFEIPRGFLQTLAQTCEGFAAGMIQFCDIMGWGMLKSVMQHMSDRLKAGARADLLELAQIPFVKSRTARVFWENGMRSLRAVAAADPKELVPLLLLAQPKKYKTEEGDDERFKQKLLVKGRVIVEAANRLWAREQQLEFEDDDTHLKNLAQAHRTLKALANGRESVSVVV
ncbi:MAG: hypothetical protein Q9181_000753 [Wetmoreana brouardii]